MAKKKKSAKKAKKKTAKKKTVGRPTQYKSRYCRMLIDFFDIEPFEDVKIPHYEKSGKTHKSGKNEGEPIVVWVDTKKVANRTPTLRRFAKKIGVGISTLYDWLDKNHGSFKREFSDAFTRARELRKDFLIENGLHGCHNPAFAKFVAVNLTDMKDVTKQEHTGEDGAPLPPIQVNVIKK